MGFFVCLFLGFLLGGEFGGESLGGIWVGLKKKKMGGGVKVISIMEC